MRNVFVETGNVRQFLTGLKALERRGADEACLLVVDGAPGLGKTTALDHWAVQNGCIYLRAKKEWTPSWFMRDLLDALAVAPAHSFERKFAQAIEALLQQRTRAVQAKRAFGIVIDEMDHVARDRRLMETIRDLSDMLRIPTVLVGMGRLRDALASYPQIASRVGQYVRFEKASPEDVARFLAERCEVPVADCLTAYIHQVTDGYNREILEAIAAVERWARLNKGAGEAVSLRDLAGLDLINDRRTGKPIRVPGAH
jgi:DNA transposition AAA+ family ATPase